jgi:cell division protein FtsW (lipid II flippase)
MLPKPQSGYIPLMLVLSLTLIGLLTVYSAEEALKVKNAKIEKENQH